MSNHGLTRNPENEPVCSCGFRPSILDSAAPVGKDWKARTVVLDHAKALNDAESANEWEAALDRLATPAPAPTPQRSPHDPFTANHERRFPRAGVRCGDDGKWIVTLWDEEGVMHAWENEGNAEHHNRLDAFEFAQWFIHVHHEVGVRLNGMAEA